MGTKQAYCTPMWGRAQDLNNTIVIRKVEANADHQQPCAARPTRCEGGETRGGEPGTMPVSIGVRGRFAGAMEEEGEALFAQQGEEAPEGFGLVETAGAGEAESVLPAQPDGWGQAVTDGGWGAVVRAFTWTQLSEDQARARSTPRTAGESDGDGAEQEYCTLGWGEGVGLKGYGKYT